MKKKLIVLGFVLSLILVVAPAVSLAQQGQPAAIQTGVVSSTCQTNATSGNIFTLLCKIGNILNAIIPVLVVLGVVYFVWGVVSYVIASDEEAKKTGRDRIIYGIIGLAVIVGVWGLVNILVRTFDLDQAETIGVPTVGNFATPGN